MDIQMADVTLHIEDTLDAAQLASVDEQLRALDGVVSVHTPEDRPHLTVVEYNPAKVKSSQVLETVRANGFSAHMIGM